MFSYLLRIEPFAWKNCTNLGTLKVNKIKRCWKLIQDADRFIYHRMKHETDNHRPSWLRVSENTVLCNYKDKYAKPVYHFSEV